jgi:hypothetical protein
MHRPQLFNRENEESSGEAHKILAAQRNGRSENRHRGTAKRLSAVRRRQRVGHGPADVVSVAAKSTEYIHGRR